MAKVLGFLFVLSAFVLSASPAVSAHAGGQLERDFQAAAAEFGVPADVLKSVSYNQTHWENHDGQPSASGGYGVMHLTDEVPAEDGRGDPDRPMKRRHTSKRRQTLREAAQMLGKSPEELKKNDAENIRGGAAVLSEYAKKKHGGQLPHDPKDWYDEVAEMSDSSDIQAAQEFADDVYTTMNTGVSQTTTEGQTVGIAAQGVQPDKSKVRELGLPESQQELDSVQPDCPHVLTCKFVSARFAQNNPADPTDYGNYDVANRERDMNIKYIVIHDTEGSYQSAIDWYQDPRSYVSAHYTIRSSDGEVTQSVQNKDVAWHAGNWYVNSHSIGIEHEGFAAEGATWYTETMYRSSAKLVRYLANKYNIPLDREHIIGHDQFHAPTAARVAGMHWDPGPYWDWGHYMDLLRSPVETDRHGINKPAVTITPNFQTNQPLITGLPAQPTNFVYLRTLPNESAPLLTDAGLHPGGEPGTTAIEDWSAKATFGQRFAVAERQGDWTAIWFGGQKGWFYNPEAARKATPTRAKLITPKQGMASVPVYGRPLPEASAYPAGGAPVLPVTPLQYSIPAGQSYVAYDKHAKNDYFHVLAFDRSTPGDGTIVVGHEKYIPIVYNHRQAYVKASDVDRVER